MLLVELTINAVVNYISIDGHALTHNWRPRIISFDAPTIAAPTNHGGFAQMSFGRMTLRQDLFSGDWPPPIVCPVKIYHTETTEAARELIFEGTAQLTPFTREGITYALFGPSYDETVAVSTAYNDTLNVVMTAILTAIPEITTVDTTYARATSPNVTHTTTGEVLAIDLASAIAAFYSHIFYIIGDTAYLVDCKLSNGADWTLTEFKFFSFPQYQYDLVASVASGQVTRFSAYPYGRSESVDAYHTTEANIIVACDDILAIENSPRIALSVPMIAGNFPKIGQKITLPDTAHVADLSSWIRVRKLGFDFNTETINIEGEGAISA